MTTPLARDKPGQDAIDRPQAFVYNACAAVACLDGIAAREVVRMRCGSKSIRSWRITIMADVPMWPDEIYRILRDWEVTQFSYVPDAGHAVLINRSLEDPEVHSV